MDVSEVASQRRRGQRHELPTPKHWEWKALIPEVCGVLRVEDGVAEGPSEAAQQNQLTGEVEGSLKQRQTRQAAAEWNRRQALQF